LKRSKGSTDVVLRLVTRELFTSYRQVPGGILWAYLEPVLTVALLTFGFSLILREPPLGHSFALFFASGYGVFHVFQTLADAMGHGFAHLKRKGKRHWPEALIARLIVRATLSVSVALSLGFGVGVAIGMPAFIDPWGPIVAMNLALLTGIAIGIFNCALFAVLPIWRRLWAILSRVLFLASGVLFIPSDMPQKVETLVSWNPLVHALSLMRDGIYHGYAPRYDDAGFVVLTSLALGALGVCLLIAFHPIPRAARLRMSL
jgi:capsular polysaccharide transport system permease protein